MQNDNYKDSLLNLRRADLIMNEYMKANHNKVKVEIVLFIKSNLGICFYKMGLLEESYTCFETGIVSIRDFFIINNLKTNLVEK